MTLLRNAGSLAITSIAGVPLGFLTNVILARYLGPAEMGHYSVLQRFTTIAFVVCVLGLPSASIYRLKRARVEAKIVTATSLSIVLSSSIALTALLFGVGGWLSQALLGSPPLIAYQIALVLIPIQAVGQTLMGLSRGTDHFAVGNSYLLALWLGLCVALGIGFAALKVDLIGALTITALVHLTSTAYFSVRMIGITGLHGRPSWPEIIETLRYGMRSQAQIVLTHIHENIDVLILAALIDAPDQVAFYAIATSIVNRVRILPASIANAFLPYAAGLDRAAAAELAARTSRNSFIWICGIALAVASAIPFVIPWAYGEKFRDVVRLVLLLLPATIFLSTSGLLARYFMGINHQEVAIRTQSCSTALNIVLNLALIPSLGVNGAAIASLLSYASELALITVVFRRGSGIPARRVFIIDKGDLKAYQTRLESIRERWK